MPTRALFLLMGFLGACGGDPEPATGDHYPIALGSSWTYSFASAGQTLAQTTTISESTAERLVRKTITSGSSTYALGMHQIAGGRVLLTGSASYQMSNDVLTASTRYEPGSLIVPADFTPGHAESTTSTVTFMPGPGVAAPASGATERRDLTVDGVESVSVPAGTFSAAKVTTLVTTTPTGGDARGDYYIAWYAPGVGRVRAATYPAGPNAANAGNTFTFDLTSFSLK